WTYPQMRTILRTVFPWSIFNRNGWSILNRYQQARSLTVDAAVTGAVSGATAMSCMGLFTPVG
ncbi:hypothetical protein, partial [Nitrosomonas aestuarii]|uniref:hypothetical protein n=1 Tax=Nitrosomonas aestuarii TaxID=52441 RepID=UPI001BAC9A88